MPADQDRTGLDKDLTVFYRIRIHFHYKMWIRIWFCWLLSKIDSCDFKLSELILLKANVTASFLYCNYIFRSTCFGNRQRSVAVLADCILADPDRIWISKFERFEIQIGSWSPVGSGSVLDLVICGSGHLCFQNLQGRKNVGVFEGRNKNRLVD